MKPLRVSVVITAWNEARGIAACLAALARQSGVAPDEREVIVVDDRSTDATAAIAAAADVPGLRLIRNDVAPAPGRMTARQHALDIGIRAARAPIVVTLDADAVTPPDFVARLIAPIEAGTADLVSGAVKFSGGLIGAVQSVDAAYYLSFCALLDRLGLDGGALFGAAAFRRDIYEQVGGFDRIGPTLTEDLAFSRAARAAGFRFAFLDQPLAVVDAAASWSALAVRAKRISAAPFGPLAAALGGWMALLVVLALAALAFGGPVLTGLALLRYAAGLLFTAVAVVKRPGWRYLPLAPVYEPLATAIGMTVALALLRDRRVNWGGVAYDR